MGMYFIGYDIGSSSVKATIINSETNNAVSSAQHPKTEMGMIAVQAGWAEQHPQEWWSSIVVITKTILSESRVKPEDIGAIGISYQMHGLVVVDKNLDVLRPSIIWCDSRAVSIGDQAYDRLGHDYCKQNLLNSPGNFTASKLAWVKNNEPSVYEQIYKAMLPGDYIAMRMSGIPQTTYSGLSEGVFYDFKEEGISRKVLDNYGIDHDIIPEVVPTFGQQSELSKSAASELGLHPGTKITYRAGDQPNNALSLNVLQPGELAATAGTSGVIYGVNEKLENDPLSRVNAFAHVNHTREQRRIGILLCINGTGILNAWARKNMGNHSYDEMNKLARDVAVGAEGLSILPFGNGAERILENKNIGAQIKGLQFNIHQNGHVFRAIQEGIACSLKYGTEIMSNIGVSASVIRAGKANLFLSDLFQEAVASLTEATIELYDTDGSQGAARGAGIGAGFYDLTNAFSGLTLIKSIHPNEVTVQEYKELYGRWKEHLHAELK